MKLLLDEGKITQKIQQLLVQEPIVSQIIETIDKEGGISYLVGGAVRDLLLGLPIKDLDIEVHKLPLQKLESILKRFGQVNQVGKAFGVLRLEHLNIDWSIPRSDESGRKPQVKVDPWMDLKKAFERRDLTMNAMGINLITYELVDPFGGRDDLQKSVLRTPNPSFFIEDPLRFYRVMQFISRFSMKPDAVLDTLCSTMDISTVSHERVETEYNKWLLQSQKPSQSLLWLDSIERLNEVMPEVAATKGVLQEPDWHPEGDVFEHTKQTIDAAAMQEYSAQEEKLIIMYAALCHDLGKATTTKMHEGKLTSYGHAKAGVGLAQKFLKRFTHNKTLIDAVKKLVEVHLYPAEFIKGHAKKSAYKRLALKLAPDVTLAMLAKVALADRQGRNGKLGKPLTKSDPIIDEFINNAQGAGVLQGVEKPILQGKDLMPEIQPGPEMGRLVKKAYELQLQEDIKDKATLKERVLKKHK